MVAGVIIGAEIPDIDFVVKYWGGPAKYLHKHRGPTHGAIVLLAHAAVIAGALSLVWSGAGFWPVFWWSLAGCVSHLVFDFCNDYGTQGLWPFSRRRIAFDIVPIIDLRLLGLIGAAWAINSVWAGPRQLVFIGLWLVIGVYILYRVVLRRRARQLVVTQFGLPEDIGGAVPSGEGWNSERVSIHPTLLSLNAWRYVIQMPGEYYVGMVWVRPGRVGRPTRARNQLDQIVMGSLKSQFVTAFSQWVRRPRVEINQQDGLHLVRWSDMRWEMDGHSPFSAYAWLDQELNLIDEGFGPKSPPRMSRDRLKRALLREMGRLE